MISHKESTVFGYARCGWNAGRNSEPKTQVPLNDTLKHLQTMVKRCSQFDTRALMECRSRLHLGAYAAKPHHKRQFKKKLHRNIVGWVELLLAWFSNRVQLPRSQTVLGVRGFYGQADSQQPKP